MHYAKWLVVGLLMGALAAGGARVVAQSLPQYLLYGRTSTNTNVPMLVSSDGTLHIN